MSAREIPLTQGYTAVVDEEDFALLAAFSWCARVTEAGNIYAVRAGGANEPATVYMHREILQCDPGEIGDHRDRDTLNNCRSNLRKCTRAQNAQNRVRRGSSEYRGAHWNVEKSRWTASITANGKRRFLGSFDSADSAARAYDAAAAELHGEFAILNFPRDGERRPFNRNMGEANREAPKGASTRRD